MALIMRAETNAGIANALGISPKTVEKHIEAAYRRLGVQTRTEALLILLGDAVPTRTHVSQPTPDGRERPSHPRQVQVRPLPVKPRTPARDLLHRCPPGGSCVLGDRKYGAWPGRRRIGGDPRVGRGVLRA